MSRKGIVWSCLSARIIRMGVYTDRFWRTRHLAWFSWETTSCITQQPFWSFCTVRLSQTALPSKFHSFNSTLFHTIEVRQLKFILKLELRPDWVSWIWHLLASVSFISEALFGHWWRRFCWICVPRTFPCNRQLFVQCQWSIRQHLNSGFTSGLKQLALD